MFDFFCHESELSLDSRDQISSPRSVAIQGDLGSNSHAAALEIFTPPPQIVSFSLSAEVFEALDGGTVDQAVLPIENSLHGSVAEHFDLLLAHGARITGESLLRIRHCLIAAPGVALEQVREVLSHPVALSQCRNWLRAHPQIMAVPFYDTAGSVRHVMRTRSRIAAAIAPRLAAAHYGAQVLEAGIEDHPENYTRFLTLERGDGSLTPANADKLTLAFSVEHRPGSLLSALEIFRDAGLNLSRLESRPIPGRPWEYVFFVDLRFAAAAELESALKSLRVRRQMVRELGRYRAAV